MLESGFATQKHLARNPRARSMRAWREARALAAPATPAAPVRSQLSAGPACRVPRLSLEPAIGLLVGRADVAHGTTDALGVASGAGFSPKVNPLFVDVFPELVGEQRE